MKKSTCDIFIICLILLGDIVLNISETHIELPMNSLFLILVYYRIILTLKDTCAFRIKVYCMIMFACITVLYVYSVLSRHSLWWLYCYVALPIIFVETCIQVIGKIHSTDR